MPHFEILKGLPAYGPEAFTYSASAMGRHSEGIAVRFNIGSGEEWVGNFVGFLEGISGVLMHPDGENIIVISSGQKATLSIRERKM